MRPYEERDIERIVELYNETTKELNWWDFNDDQKSVILFKDIQQAHQIMSIGITLVLEIQNKIVGFVMMQVSGYINFLYVDKKEIRKGYGGKLLSAIEQRAKEMGLESVYLQASKYTSDNKIYEKLGYEDKGIVSFKIKDIAFSGCRMEKVLR